jgi:hypothetical protein
MSAGQAPAPALAPGDWSFDFGAASSTGSASISAIGTVPANNTADQKSSGWSFEFDGGGGGGGGGVASANPFGSAAFSFDSGGPVSDSFAPAATGVPKRAIASPSYTQRMDALTGVLSTSFAMLHTIDGITLPLQKLIASYAVDRGSSRAWLARSCPCALLFPLCAVCHGGG